MITEYSDITYGEIKAVKVGNEAYPIKSIEFVKGYGVILHADVREPYYAIHPEDLDLSDIKHKSRTPTGPAVIKDTQGNEVDV